jgi:hypothetical protein
MFFLCVCGEYTVKAYNILYFLTGVDWSARPNEFANLVKQSFQFNLHICLAEPAHRSHSPNSFMK